MEQRRVLCVAVASACTLKEACGRASRSPRVGSPVSTRGRVRRRELVISTRVIYRKAIGASALVMLCRDARWNRVWVAVEAPDRIVPGSVTKDVFSTHPVGAKGTLV